MGVLHKFGIVTSDCSYPNVGIVKEGMDYNGWYTLIEKSNVIITTMPLITNCESEIINLLKENISHLFVDEAHHSKLKHGASSSTLLMMKKSHYLPQLHSEMIAED